VGIAFGLGFILGPALGAAFSHIDLSARFPALAPLGLNPFSMAAFGAFLLAAFNLLWVSFRFDETLPPESRGRATESRTLNPLAFFRKFEFPGVRRTNVIWFIYLLAFSGMEFTLTFLAHRRFDYTPRMNGLLFVYVGALMVLVQGGLVRRLVPRLGEKKVVAAGIAFSVPGFLLMGWAPTQGILYLGLGLMAMGSGLSQPSVTSLISLYTPPDRQGTVLGIFRSLGSFSRVLGPILATFLFWKFGSGAPYFLGAAVLLLPLGLVFGLPEPHRHD
jgi:MFS family permease